MGGFGLGHPTPPDDNVYRVTHAIFEFRNFPQHRSRFTDKKHVASMTPPRSENRQKIFSQNKNRGRNKPRQRKTYKHHVDKVDQWWYCDDARTVHNINSV